MQQGRRLVLLLAARPPPPAAAGAGPGAWGRQQQLLLHHHPGQAAPQLHSGASAQWRFYSEASGGGEGGSESGVGRFWR